MWQVWLLVTTVTTWDKCDHMWQMWWPVIIMITCGKCDHMWQVWPHVTSVTTCDNVASVTTDKCDNLWQVIYVWNDRYKFLYCRGGKRFAVLSWFLKRDKGWSQWVNQRLSKMSIASHKTSRKRMEFLKRKFSDIVRQKVNHLPQHETMLYEMVTTRLTTSMVKDSW